MKNHKNTFSLIMALAIPTMLEQLMQTAVQYIDTAMVGAIGTNATAAVGSTVTVNWLVNSTVSALSIGFLSHIAQSLGANDLKKAKRISSQAVLSCIVAGIIFTIITLSVAPFVPTLLQVDISIRNVSSVYFFIIYLPMLPRCATIIFGTLLRASGDSKTPMKVGISVNIINVILNFFFIFPAREINISGFSFTLWGADLGVIGAAIASCISFVFGGIYMTISLYKHPVISPKGISIIPDRQYLLPSLKIAFPNMIQRFATSLGYVVFASMINSLGQTATAAHTVANTVESLFYIPAYGMQTAASTLSGRALGANSKKQMKEYTSSLVKTELALMFLSGALLFIFAPALVMLFSKDSEVIRLASTVLRMVAISEPIYGVAIIIEGIIQGVGETVTGLKFNVLGMWAVRNLGTFICINFLGMNLISAWSCMIAHNFLLFVLFLVYYRKDSWNSAK